MRGRKKERGEREIVERKREKNKERGRNKERREGEIKRGEREK
jgi:hypothetical protein